MHPLLIPVVMPMILAALMVGEYALGRVLGKPTHGRRQTLNNLAVTVVYKLYGMAFFAAPFFGYIAMQQRAGIFEWSMTNPLHWIAAWLVLDFTMYWRHRAAHRVAFLWAVHSVHHQSEEYNTTVAARASMFQDTILVVMPLAILGAPVSMAMTIFAFISFVTFFSHTELVGTLGWLDKVFVTPSVHRVHHGKNLPYLDTNYGGSLVIWDRLFGTYAEETEKVEYGTLDGLDSYDPLANNLSPWQKLIEKARNAPTIGRGLLTFVMSPAWDPSIAKPVEPVAKRIPRPSRPRPMRFAVAWTLLAIGGFLQVALAVSYDLPALHVAVIAAIGLAALGVSGAVLDRGPAPWNRRTV